MNDFDNVANVLASERKLSHKSKISSISHDNLFTTLESLRILIIKSTTFPGNSQYVKVVWKKLNFAKSSFHKNFTFDLKFRKVKADYILLIQLFK